jgi:uncharacterized LabA/DUF88 family protein
MAERVAVFVDAGYLFAQGSAAISGSKKARVDISLNAQAVIDELKSTAQQCAAGLSLLRIYWYDGAIGGSRLTAEQALLAHLDDVKIRLGFVNSSGQQKGVDSLIVTDLIELARQKSICDAVLVSGDEDVRVGVQIAQNYGVRVHLVGITPSRGTQSLQLLQEADTTTEWKKECVEKFLSVRAPMTGFVPEDIVGIRDASEPADATADRSDEEKIEEVVNTVVGELSEIDIEGIFAYWQNERGVPTEFDGRILGRCRDKLGRMLERPEMKTARSRFQALIRARE